MQLWGVLLRHLPCAPHLAFRLRRLARQDVALEGARPDDLPGSCLLEALGRAPVRLELWHSRSSVSGLRWSSVFTVDRGPKTRLLFFRRGGRRLRGLLLRFLRRAF